MKITSSLAVAAVVQTASAHTIFTYAITGGTSYPIGYAISQPTYDGPITNVTSQYLACNGGPNLVYESPNVITVTAGSTFQSIWRHTLQSTSSDVIDPSHKGPVMAYMKMANNATTDGPGSGWFKISEAGYNNKTQTWAVTDLINAGGVRNITIPSCIASGRYLLRAEILALHAASYTGGAQFYMECAQINVVSGTGAKTPATVSLPGAYKANDPGILINIYQNPQPPYSIPGPTKFAC